MSFVRKSGSMLGAVWRGLLRTFFVVEEVPLSEAGSEDSWVARIAARVRPAALPPRPQGSPLPRPTTADSGAAVASAPALDQACRTLLERAIREIQFARPETLEVFFAAVERFARWCAVLPASSTDHDSDAGGLARHSLGALALAGSAIEQAPRSIKLPPDQAELFADRVKLAIALGVLFHDAGKIFDVAVEAAGGAWDPMAEPLADFLAGTGVPPKLSWREARGDAGDPMHHSKLRAVALARILPEKAWRVLTPLGAAWLLPALLSEKDRPALTLDPFARAFGEVCSRIVLRADHDAASKGRPKDDPTGSTAKEKPLLPSPSPCAPKPPLAAEEHRDAPRAIPAAPRTKSVTPAHFASEARFPSPPPTDPSTGTLEARAAPAAPPGASQTEAASAGDVVAASTPPPAFVSVALPRFEGILRTDALLEAVSEHGANSPETPIFIGAHWVAVEADTPACSTLLPAPLLSDLGNRGLLGRCSVAAAPGTEGRRRTDCKEHAARIPSLLAMRPGRDEPTTPKTLVFIHQLALDRPVPHETPSFPGRIGFAGEDHAATLLDLRFCIPQDGRNLFDEVVAAVKTGEMQLGRHFLLVRTDATVGSPRIGISYEEGLTPLLSSGASPASEESRRSSMRFQVLWDRFLRLRLHELPKPGRVTQSVLAGPRLTLVVLLPEPSKEILRHVKPESR